MKTLSLFILGIMLIQSLLSGCKERYVDIYYYDFTHLAGKTVKGVHRKGNRYLEIQFTNGDTLRLYAQTDRMQVVVPVRR